MESVTKEMDLSLRAKTYAEVAINMLKDRLHTMEKQ